VNVVILLRSGKNADSHMGKQNVNRSLSPSSFSPSPQTSDVIRTLIDSNPSKEVDDLKKSESINDCIPLRDIPTPSCTSKPPLPFSNRLRGRKHNIMLVRLGGHSPK